MIGVIEVSIGRDLHMGVTSDIFVFILCIPIIPALVVFFTLVSPLTITNIFNLYDIIHEWTVYVESITRGIHIMPCGFQLFLHLHAECFLYIPPAQ